ncbi:CML10 [Symbiodinium natans]|uniref:CML10 protein n=1 Tax=Symbiodinium natans TaxID=878477 RepID=A0A812HV19_9DINO|nr:CML10 [Symbiodinium natans]
MAPKEKKKKRTNKPSPQERMQEAFALMNLDEDTNISREEFLKAMESVGIVGPQAESLFKRFDPDGSGLLDKQEFFAYAAKGTADLRALLRRSTATDGEDPAEAILQAFQAWDTDQDGTISKAELERVLVVLNPSFTKKDMSKLLKGMDQNGDGIVDYEDVRVYCGC